MPDDLFKTNKQAFADSVLRQHMDLDWVKRLYEKNAPSIQVPGEPARSTHLMADDGKGYVYPTVIRENGKLKHLTEDQAYDYAKSTKSGIQLPQEQGSWFAANGYKQGTNVLNNIGHNGVPFNDPKYTPMDNNNFSPTVAAAKLTKQPVATNPINPAHLAAMPDLSKKKPIILPPKPAKTDSSFPAPNDPYWKTHPILTEHKDGTVRQWGEDSTTMKNPNVLPKQMLPPDHYEGYTTPGSGSMRYHQ